MKLIYKPFIVTLFVILFGCGKTLPDCSSDTVKSTLLSLIKERVAGDKTSEWYVEPIIEIITTDQKSPNKVQCKAQINFKIPDAYKNPKTEKINLSYEVQINEVNKGEFSVMAVLLNLAPVSELNNLGFESYGNYLFEKVGLEKFTQKFKENFEEDLKKAEILGPFLQLKLTQETYGYLQIKQSLLDSGWKDDGSGTKNKNTQIFSKDIYTLNIPLEEIPLIGRVVKWDDVKIWDK